MSLAQQRQKHINMVFYGVYAAEASPRRLLLRKRESEEKESAAKRLRFPYAFQM